MELLFQGASLGTVTEPSPDFPIWWARFAPNEKAAPLLPFWTFITDEENFDKEPPFPVEYLDDENWSLRLDDGSVRPIFLPAVHDDGTIGWRPRD